MKTDHRMCWNDTLDKPKLDEFKEENLRCTEAGIIFHLKISFGEPKPFYFNAKAK